MFLECFRMIYLIYNDLLATLEFFFHSQWRRLNTASASARAAAASSWVARAQPSPIGGWRTGGFCPQRPKYVYCRNPSCPTSSTGWKSHRSERAACVVTRARAWRRLPARAPDTVVWVRPPQFSIVVRENVEVTTSVRGRVRRAVWRRPPSHLASDIPVRGIRTLSPLRSMAFEKRATLVFTSQGVRCSGLSPFVISRVSATLNNIVHT